MTFQSAMWCRVVKCGLRMLDMEENKEMGKIKWRRQEGKEEGNIVG